jgi:hypothetical protein
MIFCSVFIDISFLAFHALYQKMSDQVAISTRERLLRRLPHDVKVPACSTIHAVLDRHGLVSRIKRSRTRTEGTPLSHGLSPNDLGYVDLEEKTLQPLANPFGPKVLPMS